MSTSPDAHWDETTEAKGFVEAGVAVVGPDETVGAVIQHLRARQGSGNHHLAVCDQGKLLGVVSLSRLLKAQSNQGMAAIMEAPAVVVNQTTSAERIAWLSSHARAEVVAVTDDSGRFTGLIMSHRLLPLLAQEHEIDLARLGGFLEGTSKARTASEEPIGRRVWHRAPWLLIGLSGAVAAAQIVSQFEGDLVDKVTLAFFLPGIVYMADAVGTQTETLAIRGLSVGVSIKRILRLEILTGLVVGLLLSVAIFPMALLITHETGVAATVAVSLFASASCATIVAVTLPWIIDHLSFDPAFGSGPLATVIQDLLSIVIYFALATIFVGG